MSEPWDPSLYDPTTQVPDGRVLIAAGGRTGTLELENGAKLRFPWKAQQQIANSAAPRIQSYEITSGGHTLGFQLAGAVMDTNSGTIDFQSPFPDDSGEPTLYISSGSKVGSDAASILLTGGNPLGSIAMSGTLTLYDSLAVDDITNRVGAMTIDSSSSLTLRSGGTLTVQPDANQNLALTTTGTGDIALTAGDDITLSPGGDLNLYSTGGPITITSGLNRDVDITAAGTGKVEIGTAGTTLIGDLAGVVTIGATSSTIAMAGYPISGQWSAYTPTLKQNGTAVTATVIYSRYARVGRRVVYEVAFSVTGTGTANTPVTVTLPTTASTNVIDVGTFRLYDASVNQNYVGVAATVNGAAELAGLLNASNNYAGNAGGVFTAALASGDAVYFAVSYEAAAN